MDDHTIPGWRPPGHAGLLRELGIVLLLGCLGVGLFHWATLISRLDVVQADLGDSRLVVFLLDHWRRVFAGSRGWASPAMWHPLTGALGYSDMLLGIGLPYSLFRWMGLGLFEAANATMVLLSLLSYLAAYWLLRRVVRVSMLPAIAGALCFALAHPKLLQLPHLQLRFDFFQPMALASLLPLWLEDRAFNPREISARTCGFVALWCLGAETCYYNAWFLLFWVLCTAALSLLFPDIRQRTKFLFREGRRVFWQPLVLGAILLIPFLYVHLRARHSGTGRSWPDTVLPALWDYTRLGSHHLLWGWSPLGFPPDGPENRLGFGLALTAILIGAWAWSIRTLIGALLRRGPSMTARGSALLAAALVSSLFVTTISIRWGAFAPWRAIHALVPGASALIAVGRWTLTLALVIAIVVALWLDREIARAKGHRLRGIGLLFVAALATMEQFSRLEPQYSSARVEQYHRDAAAVIPSSCTSFLLVPSTPGGRVPQSQFDSARYLEANPDVARDWPHEAWTHYKSFGYREGRKISLWLNPEVPLISHEAFDGARYLAANPDVASGWRGTPWDHYRLYGFREGRSLDLAEARTKQWENFHFQMSALVISALTGKPTLNGGSGSLPRGYPFSNVLDTRIEDAFTTWLRRYPDAGSCMVRLPLHPDDLPDKP